MENELTSGYILGIDLGSNSLGTALISPSTTTIVHLGVRIFPAGVEGDLDQGKEESRSAKRRGARLARRQTRRRARRMYKVFRYLQTWGILGEGPQQEVLFALQQKLERRYPETQTLPYFLRAEALKRSLDADEIARALYHLAQRRGFLSNRAAGSKEDPKERSVVKSKIKGLKVDIASKGFRTLGEYLASLNPHESRIRGRYTHRSMYEEEFQAIWDAQSQHHPDLLNSFRREKLERALFHQRPLKDQSDLIGDCELKPTEKRAPLRNLLAQQVRVLGFVNNLRLRLDDGNQRTLTEQERQALLDLCSKSPKLTFGKARKELDLGRLKFTIEEGGEKNVPCDLTSSRLRDAIGATWDGLTPVQREDLAEDVGDPGRFVTEEDMEKCAREKWGLDAQTAERLAEVHLPDGYARFSLAALRKLVPWLQQGLTVEEAKDKEFPEHRKIADPLPLLPPVRDLRDLLGEVRNPAVLRSLSELRKTVNAIVRRYGKPAFVRIELARDLKKGKQERIRDSNRNRDREKLREEAVAELRKYDANRFANPKQSDVEKYMLAREANQKCPYTGQVYGFTDVFGEHPQVDVEHIIPYSRCLDNSFVNKTLAFRSANVEKGNRTPHEWLYEGDGERYDRMVDIVKHFDARFQTVQKLSRFTMGITESELLLREFSERQLQETRYASKLAAKYLGALYGGINDAEGTKRVSTCAGQITAILREAWDINRILSDSPFKSREDHRHHAIDAASVALTSESMVQHLSRAAGDADRLHKRHLTLPAPWENFRVDLGEAVEKIQISHRPARRLSGPLHEETIYSPPRKTAAGKTVVHYRVPLVTLTTEKDFAQIVDPTVRAAVIAKRDELGGGGPKFEKNWPQLQTRKGASIPIRRVRISKVTGTQVIGKPGRERSVIPGSNHHAVIYAELNVRGEPASYGSCAVTMLEAHERQRQKAPVVQRDHGPGTEFRCTLSEGDLLEATRPKAERPAIWCVRSVKANGKIVLSPSRDARQKDKIIASKGLWEVATNVAFKYCGARKVLVNHLGEVTPAND